MLIASKMCPHSLRQKKVCSPLTLLVALLLLLPRSNGLAQEALIPQTTRDSLTAELTPIAESDQYYRQQMENVQHTFGGDSKEMKQLIRSMKQTDSLNFIKVSAILEKFGWLGPETIGSSANTTLFMVIQHSDLAKQQHYLPTMRQAVKQGKASAAQLALLEDRVALLCNKKQIYGSQVAWNMKTNAYKLLPLENPVDVDRRRLEVGLPPLKEYLKACCGMEWDLDSYLREQNVSDEKGSR